MTDQPPDKPHLVSVAFVAEFFGVSEQTVRNWIKSGLLPNSIRVGRQFRIMWSDVQALLQQQYGDGDMSVSPATPPGCAS